MFPVRKLVLFALLNVIDFGLTWYLLRVGGGSVYESNPVAAWCLGRYGWLGLAGFKAGIMVVTAGLGVFIFFRRPQTGHRLLAFGCAALAAVVVYSGYLCDDLRRRPAGLDPSDAVRYQENNGQIDVRLRQSRAYRHVLAALTDDLRRGRCALKDGVARLEATEQARDANWMEQLRSSYPGRGDSECLAVTLINHIQRERVGTDMRPALQQDLETQFLTLFGHTPPNLPDAVAARQVPDSV